MGEKAKKEKDFKVKNTCTVTAYEHNDYKGRVTQTVKYCGGTATNFRFATNASEKRAKGAAAAKAHAEKDNKAEISNKEKAKKELDQKEKKQKEMQQKSAEKAKKEKDFKVKNTCTVTAYEHNDYKGRVTQTVKYCGGT